MTRANNVYCFKIDSYWEIQSCKTLSNPKLQKNLSSEKFSRLIFPLTSCSLEQCKTIFFPQICLWKEKWKNYQNISTYIQIILTDLLLCFVKIRNFTFSKNQILTKWKVIFLPNLTSFNLEQMKECRPISTCSFLCNVFIFRKFLTLCSNKVTLLNLWAVIASKYGCKYTEEVRSVNYIFHNILVLNVYKLFHL